MKKLLSLVFIVICSARATAGLQINARNTLQGFAQPITNSIVTKMETNGVRIDTDSTMTTIVLPDAGGAIQLFHPIKTYRWLANDSSIETNVFSPIAVSAGGTTLNDAPAQLFCWTNGTDHGRIWLQPSEMFLKSDSNQLVVQKSVATLTANLVVGSLFSTNFVVAQTERISLTPVSMRGVQGANQLGTVLTNVMLTQTASLISVTVTNFSPSEFALPTDYQDAATQPPPQYQVDPNVMGRIPAGPNLDGLRKQYEQGQPLLAPIPYSR